MSAWRVVTFLEEDTVEAVPMSWIRSPNQRFWPPFSGLKLKTAISKCMPPASDWDLHEARTIGDVYGDLSVARVKAVEAENSSDLNSDSGLLGLGHRKIRMNKKYLMDSDSDQEKDDTPSSEVSEIVMPVLKKGEKKKSVHTSYDLGIGSTSVSGNAAIEDEMSCLGTNPSKNIEPTNGTNPSRNIEPTNGTNPSKNIEPTNGTNSSKNIEPTNGTNPSKNIEPANGIKETDEVVCSNNNMKDEQFKRQVLRNLSILNFKIDQLGEDIAQINLKKPEVPTSPSIFLKFNFPLSTEEDLQTFEDFLADKDNYKQVQLELSRIGGNTTKIMVKRIMDKLLSSKLGMAYSWVGFKKKKNFSVLLIAKVLIDAVMTIHPTSNAAEVETSSKQWLVKSRERFEKGADNQL